MDADKHEHVSHSLCVCLCECERLGMEWVCMKVNNCGALSICDARWNEPALFIVEMCEHVRVDDDH